MSYSFKGKKVIINGEEQIINPSSLPSSPSDGHFAVDSSDGKFKVYNESKSRWIALGDAEDVYFDNSSNDFESQNTQEAIEEARQAGISASPIYYTENANNQITTNSSTYQIMSGMSITPPEGKYLVIFNGTVDTTGVNTEGEISLHLGGSLILNTVRLIRDSTSIGGLITLSTHNSSSSRTIVFPQQFNGSQTIDARYRHISGGSVRARERNLTLVRIFTEEEIGNIIGNYDNSPIELDYDHEFQTGDTSTSSTSYVLISGMSMLPTSGDYLVSFQTSLASSLNSVRGSFAVFIGNSLVEESQIVFERAAASAITPISINNIKVSVNGSQTIQIRWKVTNGNITSIDYRNMNILKIG